MKKTDLRGIDERHEELMRALTAERYAELPPNFYNLPSFTPLALNDSPERTAQRCQEMLAEFQEYRRGSRSRRLRAVS